MKKYYTLIFLELVMIFALITPVYVLADKQPPVKPNLAVAPVDAPTFLGSFGQRGYSSISKKGYVDMTALTYDVRDVGFYAPTVDGFVGAEPALTLITGSCDRYNDPVRFMRALLYVDNKYYKELFATSDYVAPFSMPVFGQTFAIRIYINGDTTISCNVLLERVK